MNVRPIFATAGNAEKVRACYEIGADHVINYREDAFEEVILSSMLSGGSSLQITCLLEYR